MPRGLHQLERLFSSPLDIWHWVCAICPVGPPRLITVDLLVTSLACGAMPDGRFHRLPSVPGSVISSSSGLFLCDNGTRPFPLISSSVPNNDIGGSGVVTCWLEWMGAWCLAVGRSLALCVGVALLAMLIPRRCPSGSRGCGAPNTTTTLLRPVGSLACPRTVVLDWTRPPPQQRHRRGSFSCSSPTVRFCTWLLCWLSLPRTVWAAPSDLASLLEATEVVTETPSGSLNAPEHLPTSSAKSFSGRALLGVQILAPHYHPAYFEIPLEATKGTDQVLRAAEPLAKAHIHRSFSVLAPCRPQLFRGYVSLVAQPACLAAAGSVVVILDLNALDGSRFACILPAVTGEQAVRRFVTSLVGTAPEGFELFVGDGNTPCPAGSEIPLATGDVVRALPVGVQPASCTYFEPTADFRPGWGASDQFPRPLCKPGICLLFGSRRFFINRRQYPTKPPAAAAARTAGTSTDTPVLKVANNGLEDVLLRGNTCRGVACVVDIPALDVPARGPERQDNFCFFDLRPLGLKPVCHYQIGEMRHLPTVLNLLGVQPPNGWSLAWDGDSDGGFLSTRSGEVVIVHAVPATHPNSEADDDPPSDPPDPSGDDDGPSIFGDDPDDDGSSGASALLPGPAGAPAPGSPPRRRSRSPRRHGGAGCIAAIRMHTSFVRT